MNEIFIKPLKDHVYITEGLGKYDPPHRFVYNKNGITKSFYTLCDGIDTTYILNEQLYQFCDLYFLDKETNQFLIEEYAIPLVKFEKIK